MLDCPHLVDGRCKVAESYAGPGYECRPSEKYCQHCSEQDNPRNINCVTLNLAGQARRARATPTSDLKPLFNEFCPRKDPIKGKRKGPGTELEKIIPGFFKKSGCGCNDYARKMDAYGIQGCREHFDQIVEHLVLQAAKTPLLKWRTLNRMVARKWVTDAIKAAEDNQ